MSEDEATTQNDEQRSSPKPNTARKNRRPRLRALFDFDARVGNELSFKKGDVITLIEEHESGMWKGELNNEKGYFPYNYVQLYDRYDGAQSDKVVEDETPESISKKGWMTKQGHVVKNWKQRWFVLKNSMLMYYKSDADTTHPAGVIDLADAAVQPSDKKDHCMELTTKDKVFYISVGSKPELLEWMHTIRKARPAL
ncbi:PH domain [Carpediemonas membranifera]|uniref:PH domain n=1 Tax=Carpediemonas membranifera TaxID=201153 RepID=A0A8J6B0S8_9EUKA|nr:PH domain [Carpediemonas membranifera]|eukprot:KAG9395970.1 PH domain [Carpediemonas membranifera]